MRDIKFKIWNKIEKRMYSYVNVKEISPIHDRVIVSNGNKMFDFHDIELLQYTGLTDKNGTPIYEGDIIKAYHWSLDENFNPVKDESSYDIREVVWSDEHASYLVLGEIDNLPSDYLGNCSQIEVMGNKFEHGELLEQ